MDAVSFHAPFIERMAELGVAGSTPSEDPSSEEAGPSAGIGWEDLESLAFELSGDSIQLVGGRATVSYGGASTDVFTLQNRVAAGDLDADGDDDLVAHIVEDSAGTGVFHTVANHAWNHENLAGLPRSSFDDTIGRTQAVLADRATPCLRPPYGSIDAFTREWAMALGLDLVLWTVDTNDWRKPGAQVIADRIVRGATDEAIVLMHDDGGGNRTQTVEGLELALDRLSGRGLRFESVCT